MTILVEIEHATRYHYDRPISLSPHLIRLRPAPHSRTPVERYTLHIEPAEHRIYWQQDAFGNQIARVVIPNKTDRFAVEVRLVAAMTVINPFDFYVESYAERFPFQYDPLVRVELEPYLETAESGPLLRKWLAVVPREPRRIVDFLVALNTRLQGDIGYTIRMDPGIQTCEETLTRRTGSCRDTGWLLVQILRHLGLAARFVSGYLVQLKPDEKPLDGPAGPTEDFTDLHAWAEVYIPGAGWVGLDPTSGLFAGEGHIPLACTPDPVSAAPITGLADPCEVEFEYANIVRRVREDPRVTYPYNDAQWAEVGNLGRRVDAELRALDVRLTMGGEPTFVSVDDMEGAEWNTEAMGVHKRERADLLLRKLRETFAPGGLLHFGQGKWYPGEPLPRWALGCYWRRDGQPLWRDPRWLTDGGQPGTATVADAERWVGELAERLGVPGSYIHPTYEDWLYYLWREANQPANASPAVRPATPSYHDDVGQALRRGLDSPIGYVLPLRWDWGRNAWVSGPWNFGRDRLYLMPGSSPIGLRLPMAQLDWYAEVDEDPVAPPPPPLPTAPTWEWTPPLKENKPLGADATPEKVRERFKRWVGVPHTALCVEVRNGWLHVFMPPVEHLEHYAGLLNVVEAVSAALGLAVVLEGYPPPSSPVLDVIKVTPDPGVIEVNIHPAADWESLERNTVDLYEAARQARLGAEKFMLDGRHTGTGGGNHITLGGSNLADSPFLRRPELLTSLITYWQHHPSLAYLFSGLFIGPTSQAPRVDECRRLELRDLTSGMREIGNAMPWVVDRTLRSFLSDLSGNTHRAELCIDKLHSLDGPAGRQGLVELRGFEMPPHARMSLAQMLLIRVLTLHFWKQPYRHPLISWGTALQDRYLLPHFVWEDFCAVLAELNAAGYPLNPEWYLAFLEFRFPHYGQVEVDGMTLELRMALEPWPVLGEEAGVQRQARVVDSAVERLQVRCAGFDAERWIVTCNGRRVPLTSTGKPGESIAGVRYKAWKAAFGLHPTVEVHAPLVFDVFDRRVGKSVGGCVYHVAHPGGRAYDNFPVNAYEAESRRISRFWPFGHSAGDVAPPSWVTALTERFGAGPEHRRREPAPESPNTAFPLTLDLRRPL